MSFSCKQLGIFVAALLCACSTVRFKDDATTEVDKSDTTFYPPEQVTAGSESNFAPDLSPNGDFVVYTSDRKGNKDVWEKRASGGFARPVTLHAADDFYPVLSPDGDQIAFVSRRGDAAGDILIIDNGFRFFTKKEGAISVISSNQTEDTTPSWFPDGKKIVFAARHPGEQTPQLMVAELKDLKPIPLGDAHGDQPSVAPDGLRVAFVRDGAIHIYHQDGDRITQVTEGGRIQDGQPRFSQDGKSLLFIRYADDTNMDGQLDGDDRPTVWRLDLEAQGKAKHRENYGIVPLTSAAFAAYSPQIRKPYLYVALQTQEGLDIFRFPNSGQAQTGPTLEDVQKQFDQQSDYFAKTYILRRAEATFQIAGQVDLAAEAALMELQWLVQNGRNTEAAWSQAKLAANFPDLPEIVALSDLALVTLSLGPIVYPHYKDDLTQDQTLILASLKARVAAIDAKFTGEDAKARRVRGASALVTAKMLASERKFFEANALLAKTIESYKDEKTLSAEAAYYAALITPATSDTDTAIRALRAVAMTYSDNRNIVLLSSQEAVRLLEDRKDRLEALVALRIAAEGVPIMPALAHMRISDIYMEEGKEAVAANELRLIVDSYPESPEIKLIAAERLSILEEKVGRYEAAESMLKSLGAQLATAKPEHVKAAKALLVDFLLRRGESLLKAEEPGMAIKEYRKVVELDALNVSAHRGIIDGSYARKELDPLRQQYEREAEANPESAERRYFYGYALSYEIDKTTSVRERIGVISNVIKEVEAARVLDSQLLHVHQTLGWLYLQKGYWQAKYYESGSILAKVRQKTGMVQDFIGAANPNWLELAIDSFQTAFFLSRPDSIERADLARNLGHTYYELKNYQKSLSYYMQRVKMLAVVPLREQRAEGLLLRQAGRAAFQIEELELAESLQRSALAAWETVNDDEKVEYSIDALALTIRQRGHYKEALALYARLRRINERLDQRVNLVGTLTNLGYCAYMDTQYDAALGFLDEAEKALSAVQASSDVDASTVDSKAIKVDLGGEASAAKGFDMFARLNVILSFRTKIYEKIGRDDLAIDAAGKKLEALQKQRLKLIDEDDKPDSVLAEEISIQQNNLAAMRLRSGFHVKARAGFADAAVTAKLLRPNDQTYMSPGELKNTINKGRVELRLAALELVPTVEVNATAAELEASADALAPVVNEGANAQGRPLANMLTIASGLRIAEGDPAAEAKARLDLESSLTVMQKVNVSAEAQQGVLFAFQGMPGQLPDGQTSDAAQLTAVSDFKKLALESPVLQWKVLAGDNDAPKAFEALDRSIYSGNILRSPPDRQLARIVFESMLHDAAAKGDHGVTALLMRRYLLMRYTELALRTAGVMEKVEGAPDKLVVPKAFDSLLALKETADLQGSLDDDEAILVVNRSLQGEVTFVLMNKKSTTAATAQIPYEKRADAAAYSQALQASSIANALPAAGVRLYIVPIADLWEVPWEMVTIGGSSLKSRNVMAFLPSPDFLPTFRANKSVLKASTGFIGATAPDASITSGNAGRDFALVTLDGQDALAAKMQAFNLVHVASPLLLNDVEPGKSAIFGEGEPVATRYLNDLTLNKLAGLDLSSSSGLIFANVQRNNPDLLASGEGHDGWAFLAMVSAAARVQAAILVNQSAQGADWATFYTALNDKSLSEALHAAALPGRLVGYGGMPGSQEVAYAESKLDETVSEAEDAYDEGEFPAAVFAYKRAYYYALRTGKTDIEDASVGSLVKALFQLRDYAGALHYKRKIAAKLKPAPKGQPGDDRDAVDYGSAIVECAVLAVRASQFDEAERYLSEAEVIFTEEDEPAQLGKISQYRGINFENQKKYAETIASYSKSRERYKVVNPEQAAQRLLDIGSVYLNRYSDYAKALEFYESATVELKALGKQEAYLPTLIDKANAQIATGDIEAAISVLEKEAVPTIDRDTQKFLWIRATQSLANAYLRAGLYQEALDLNVRTLAEIAKIDDKDKLKRVEFQIDAINLKGYALAALGQYKDAFDQFKAAISLASDFNRKGQLALLYNNYGFWAREYGSVDPSIDFFNIALKIDEELKSPSGIAIDNRNLALSIIIKGDYNRARDLLTQSLKTSLELNMTYNVGYCYFGLADASLREGKWAEAETNFRKALDISEKGFMLDFVWRAWGGIASAIAHQGRLDEAETNYATSIQIIEKFRAGLKSDASRNAFLSDAGAQEIYEAYAAVLMKRGKVEQAWTASERARSRAFIDSLGTQKIRFANQELGVLLEEEKEKRSVVESLDRKVVQAKGTAEEASLGKELQGAEARYAELLETMRTKNRQLVDFVNVEATTKEELGTLIPADTALVEYMVTPDALLVWVIKGGQVTGKSIEVTSKDLEQHIRDFRLLMENFSSTDYLGKELARWLIDPIKDQIEGAKRLVIVPHGNLHFLSFAALPFGDGAYLVDTFPLYYLDSATLARFTHHKNDTQTSRLGKGTKILAVANPTRDEKNLAPLPFTAKEADVIPRYFPDTITAEGDNATELIVREGATKYDVLHIAAHGEFFPNAPAKSRLLLAAGGGADGDLAVTGIIGMSVKADMVTLSACESGLGKLSPGDEIVGMNRAFFFAGADTVVSSLWRISDVASAVTMKRFYRYLSEGMTKDQAMREAQLVVRRYFKHPAYWSAFRVVGDYK